MMGRLLSTHPPERQGCRILNLDPAKAVFLPAFLPVGREPRGSVLGRCRTFISLGRELGGEAAQDFTKRRPRLGFDWLRHGFNHEGSHDRKVGKVCPVPGNVCRAR